MIKLYRAKKESRRRDLKRKRFILEIGKKKLHLTAEEVKVVVCNAVALMVMNDGDLWRLKRD